MKKRYITLLIVFLTLQSVDGLHSLENPEILFDEYHATWKPSILTDVLSDLENKGYNTSFSNEKISSSLLSGYDVLVLIIPFRYFHDDERAAVEEFVKNGGGLIIFGEHGGYMDQKDISNKINSISSIFGIEFNSDVVEDSEKNIEGITCHSVITSFKRHPVTEGVQTAGYICGCSLTLNSSATALAFGNSTTVADGKTGRDVVVLAVAEYGKGKVLAIGDTDFLGGANTPGYEDRDFLSFGDNRTFVMNMFQWVTPLMVDVEEAHQLAATGYTLFDQREYAQAKSAFESALGIYQQVNDTEKVAEMQSAITMCTTALDAEALYEEGMDFYEEGEHESAKNAFQESKDLYDEIGDTTGSGEAQDMMDTCSAALGADVTGEEEAEEMTGEGVEEEDRESESGASGIMDMLKENVLFVLGGVAVVIVIVLIAKWYAGKSKVEEVVQPPPPPELPLEPPSEESEALRVLKQRYAEGEITREEYERTKSILEES